MPTDKPFTPEAAPTKPFTGAPPPTSAFIPPPGPPALDPEVMFPHPWGRYQLEPDQSVALGNEIAQFINLTVLVYKQVGEEFQVYRRKRFGETCACVDSVRNQAQDGCAICFGTKFVGGYDFVGETLGYIGPNPLTQLLTEIGLKVSQKPGLWLLPVPPIRERDFIVARGRKPLVDLLRFQEEPVVRAALDPNMDALAKQDVSRVLKLSNSIGGTEDYAENVDFVLTGGELVVQDALTAPPNTDARYLRILGKRYPLFPPAGETPTGTTIPNPTLAAQSGLSAGQAITVIDKRTNPQAFTTTMLTGSGLDAGFLLVLLQGIAGSGISNQTTYPAAEFLAVVKGDTILWLTGGNRPASSATYYASYEVAINTTRRYQLLNFTTSHYQGAAIVQQAEIELMDPTHPIYSLLTFYDNGQALDRQDLLQRALKKIEGQASGLEQGAANNADPRFANPGDFT